MGDLKFQKLLSPYKITTIIGGLKHIFTLNEEFCSSLCLETKFRLQSKGDDKSNFVIFPIILPVMYIHGMKPLNKPFS